jgi:hypothetical protein
MPCPVLSCPAQSCPVLSSPVLTCPVLCCAVLCCAVLCCAAWRCAVLSGAGLCCAGMWCAVLCCPALSGAGLCRPARPGPVRSLFHTNTHSLPQSNATAASQPSRYRPDAHVVIGHRYAHCHHHGVFGAAGHPRGRTNGCLSALPISPTCPLRQPLLQLRPAVCPPWPANCTKTIQMMKT